MLGIEGLVVESVLIDDAGRRVVHCSTDPELAGWCPVCRQQSSSPKERVTTRPRDVRIGPDRPVLLWHKRKWHCRVPECERKVFTEALPADIPARARITTRARRAAAQSIGDHCRPVSGVAAEFAFVPHSGPFARGIHMTVQARLKSSTDPARVLPALREFYARSPFVRVLDTPPRVKDVATSNYAHLSATASGRIVAVMCVVDNLNKGAAGGAVQWMNRIYGLPETAGLITPAPGWT